MKRVRTVSSWGSGEAKAEVPRRSLLTELGARNRGLAWWLREFEGLWEWVSAGSSRKSRVTLDEHLNERRREEVVCWNRSVFLYPEESPLCIELGPQMG